MGGTVLHFVYYAIFALVGSKFYDIEPFAKTPTYTLLLGKIIQLLLHATSMTSCKFSTIELDVSTPRHYMTHAVQ